MSKIDNNTYRNVEYLVEINSIIYWDWIITNKQFKNILRSIPFGIISKHWYYKIIWDWFFIALLIDYRYNLKRFLLQSILILMLVQFKHSMFRCKCFCDANYNSFLNYFNDTMHNILWNIIKAKNVYDKISKSHENPKNISLFWYRIVIIVKMRNSKLK